MRSVAKPSIVDSVLAELRAEIHSGAWRVGDKIPSELQLAATLGVSRLSVREAVRVLVHSGLLSTRQGDGTYVMATDESEVALSRRLERAAQLDIIDVRRGLDLVAARLAAAKRTEADLEGLREASSRRTDASRAGELDAFADADVDFHVRVAHAAHNPVLGDLYRGLSQSIRQSVRDDHCLQRAVRPGENSHEDLLAAIERRDQAAAVAAALAILDQQESDL
ncbi:FadR/GntR family transcriptional regulator [Nonomuraea sp. NPDC050663]|uniref:FadR/GntR family transcriptional regulator n=1 Tax=Nonomuraea sp. NPDC050663 TaxID=3364370 RepID=UPI0037AD9552